MFVTLDQVRPRNNTVIKVEKIVKKNVYLEGEGIPCWKEKGWDMEAHSN